MASILSIATASLRPDQLTDNHHLRYPRVDFLEMQHLLDVDTINYTVYENSIMGGVIRRIETLLRSDLYLANMGWLKSRHYGLTFSWSERTGIPLAWFRRSSSRTKRFITMFHSWSKRQERAITSLNLLPMMDSVIVHCQSMKSKFLDVGMPDDRIHVIPYSVDQRFFIPQRDIDQQSNYLVSIGENRSRDYSTLMRAVTGLPIKIDVAASGLWYAREKHQHFHGDIPANVSIIRNLPRRELRNYYARSQFVVLPIKDVVYSAGATVVLEAGCMERAVIATRSQGIVDYIIDGETGILVNPGDVGAMQNAIKYLLSHPEKACRLGKNARQRIEDEFNLETYVSRIANLLQSYCC